MNGEVHESIVAPDSLEERDYKTLPPSDFLPIYMGKWSKEPEGDGMFCKDLLHNNNHPHHNVDRFSQPDVTQTEPKAPEDEIAHTMKKLNECFQNLVCLPESEMSTNETNGFEPHPIERNEVPAIDVAEEEDEDRESQADEGRLYSFNGNATWPDIRNDLTENERHQEEEKMPRNETLEDYLHRADTLPRSVSYNHKIYVDFLANELLCEGCGSAFGSLNEAADHWKSFGPAGDATESSVDVTDGKSAIDYRILSEATDRPLSENSEKQLGSSENEELCKTPESNDATGPGSDDIPAGNDGVPDEASSYNNNNDSEGRSDDVLDSDNTSKMFLGFSTPLNEKQNGDVSYGTGLGEKELLIIDDNRRNKKKTGKGRKKKKKNKPLKFIRRAFMLTLTFLF